MSVILLDLRQAPQHLPRLAAWHDAEWGHYHPGRRAGELAAQMRADYLHEAPWPLMVVAEVDGVAAGSASLVAQDMDTHPELGPWLANVYVDAAQRGRGLGRLLVRRIMDEAARLGLAHCYLFTHDQADFYAGLGWEALATEDYHGEPVTLMRWRPRLAAAPR